MKRIKENSGEKIQKASGIVLVVGILISIVLGCVPLVTFSNAGIGGTGFIICVVIIGLGCFSSWITSVVINGIGETVSFSAQSASYLEGLYVAQTGEEIPIEEETAKDEPNSEVKPTDAEEKADADTSTEKKSNPWKQEEIRF